MPEVLALVHPPGVMYLQKATRVMPSGDRCEHDAEGQWLVLWGNTLYSIQPANNLQMRIWLDEATNTVGVKRARGALRWYCWKCETVQYVE